MRKKIVAVMLLACLCFTGTACGSKSGQAKNAEASGAASPKFDGKLEKNVTIQVLENDTAISKGYFQELIDAFNKEYKDKGLLLPVEPKNASHLVGKQFKDANNNWFGIYRGILGFFCLARCLQETSRKMPSCTRVTDLSAWH